MPTLSWIGKEKVLTHHVPYHVLDHKYGFRSSDPGDTSPTGDGNMIIHGDNLEALKALLPRYEGAVKCIYIDPPYNTGKEGWVYDDNVNDPRLKKWLGEVVGPEGEDLSRDDKWLCMMYPRLVLLRRLLRKDGVIFISIDDNEQANLKLICDEIFGALNYMATLIWDLGTGTTAGHFTRGHEYILCYAKNKELVKNFRNEEDNQIVRHGALKKISKKNPPVEITFPAGFKYAGKDAVFEGVLGESEKEYILSTKMEFHNGRLKEPVTIRAGFAMRRQIEDFIAGKKVFDTKGQPVTDFYFNSNGILFYEKGKTTINPRTVLSSIANTKNGTTELKNIFGSSIFDFPKPSTLIEYLLELTTDKDSLILDSFAGSGTTAHAVLELNKKDGGNRKFILIEKMDYAESITAERVKRVMTGYPYMGKKEEDIYSVELTEKNLSRGAELLQEAQFAAETAQGEYDKISKPRVKNGRLKVVGTTVYEENMPGLGGEFDYYELGEPLFKQDNLLNEAVGEDKIREYIYYSETMSPLTRSRKGKEYFLDKFNGVGYYFYYNPQALTSLNLSTLNIITEKAESYVIYADVCNLPESFLSEHNIVFKQIPRDIKRF